MSSLNLGHRFFALPGQSSVFNPQNSIRTHIPSNLQQCSAVRLAEHADIPALAAIEDVSRPGGNWSATQVAEELDRERATVLVKDYNGDVGGWIVTWHVPPDELHILEVAVASRHRRQGIATELLQASLSENYRGNAAVALLEVRASNENAIALYRKAGFVEVGRRKKFYSDGEDAVLMNCELS